MEAAVAHFAQGICLELLPALPAAHGEIHSPLRTAGMSSPWVMPSGDPTLRED